MAKREFIEPCEIVYINAPIAPILQGDSVHYEDIAYEAQIKRITTYTEQDIVKPYLDKISAKLPSMSHYQSSDGQDLVMIADVLELINNLLSDQGDTE